MKIVVDAMGGDHAPGVVVEGAVMAAREFNAEIVLVGREADIKRELARHQTDGLALSIVHASEVVEMDDHVSAVRAKRDNSMSVGLRLVKERRADGFVSAGNSGAVMAAALFGVGRIRGIDRPALASIFPASKTPAVLIDLGANTDPTPQNLAQFAMLGSIYADRVLGIPQPRVAIVSNGEEIEKGNELVKAATPLLQASGLNFIGSVEGKDVPKGVTDVIVTDGFTGNVILKLTEGLVSFMTKTLKEYLTGGVLNKIGLVLMIPGLILMLPGLVFMLPAVQRMRKRMDYRELGAAPLLGVDGVVLIAHGRSDAKAIRGAIRATIRAAEVHIVDVVKSNLSQAQPTSSSTPAAQA